MGWARRSRNWTSWSSAWDRPPRSVVVSAGVRERALISRFLARDMRARGEQILRYRAEKSTNSVTTRSERRWRRRFPRCTVVLMSMLPRLVDLSVITVLLAAPLGGQCPNGSPPPCRPQGTRPPPAPNSVAVLYFDDLSRDTADIYLSDGITEEIIIRLGQVQRLEVKSRFEVQRYRGRALPDPQALGRSLSAAYLLTGSVQRAHDQVRLRAELVRTANRAHVWGDVF